MIFMRFSSKYYRPWARGHMPPPPGDFCKLCFLVRLWYTKTIAIVLTEQFLRLFGPRVENKLNIYIFDPWAKKC